MGRDQAGVRCWAEIGRQLRCLGWNGVGLAWAGLRGRGQGGQLDPSWPHDPFPDADSTLLLFSAWSLVVPVLNIVPSW